LPRETVVIEPETDTSLLKQIGAEVTETLQYHPPKLIVLRRERPKYVDPANEDRGVIIASLPARPIDKGIAEPSLLANVTIEKYVDHLPLYRQVQRFTRLGITMAASTLGDWVSGTADLLVPLYNEMVKEAKASGYIQADETPIQVQDGDKKGKTHRGWYWVYHAREPGIVIMDYQAGRGRDGPRTLLAGYEGLLQCDGYQVYDQFDSQKGISLAGCWAHARRYFFEAKGSAENRAEHVLGEISLLYDIERVLREENASPEERRRVRQEKAAPILDKLRAWLEENEGLPRAPWGKAVSYALTRWNRLIAYLEEGRLEIDNNLVENTIRPVALGRKNYLFAGSHDAAQRAAVIYSLLATCKKHGVNPQVWLTDVLTRIPNHPAKDVSELLPHHWKEIQG
jgi:transposase